MTILGDLDEFYDAPREFHILGSSLFHRGLLVSSHLSKTDTVDILLWLKANRNILAVSSKHPVKRVVAWKEIHPSKHINDDTEKNTDARRVDRYEWKRNKWRDTAENHAAVMELIRNPETRNSDQPEYRNSETRNSKTRNSDQPEYRNSETRN